MEIDNDNRLYEQMLAEPWFPQALEPSCLSDRHFLTNIFDQSIEKAYRRNRGRWGKEGKAVKRNVGQTSFAWSKNS